MNLNLGMILNGLKIVLFFGMGIFMLVVGNRLEMNSTLRIAWGVALILFGAYRVYLLFTSDQVEAEEEEESQNETQEKEADEKN